MEPTVYGEIIFGRNRCMLPRLRTVRGTESERLWLFQKMVQPHSMARHVASGVEHVGLVVIQIADVLCVAIAVRKRAARH